MSMPHVLIPRGQPIPQTVPDLLHVMAQDAIRMEEMAKEITRLKADNEKLRAKLMKRGRQ